MGNKLTRRDLFRAASAAGVAAAVPRVAAAQVGPRAAEPLLTLPHPPDADPAQPLRFFFNQQEDAFVTAAVDRLIPADPQWPSASQAGVVDFIDRQLAGAYGAGARLYLRGPFAEGTPQQGYQLPHAPAQLYRLSIQAISGFMEREYGGRTLDQLADGEQDTFLQGLEKGTFDITEIYTPVFFETLLANTIEGYFADPAYGGNRGMAGWRMIGFPGAYAQYLYEVENHGMHFDRVPMSMAESVHGHEH